MFPTAAAIGARTSKIRIGTFIHLLPFSHPVRAAEDLACADIISNGRIDYGIGQGYSYHEWNAFCMNRSERGVRMREGIERHFYSMPYRERNIWGVTAGILRNLHERLYS